MSRGKKATRKAEREQRRMPPQQEYRGKLARWRCAKRCGEGKWTPELDVPKTCPSCGAGIDIER